MTLLSDEPAQTRYEGFARSLREDVLPSAIRIILVWAKGVGSKCIAPLYTFELACALEVSPGSIDATGRLFPSNFAEMVEPSGKVL